MPVDRGAIDAQLREIGEGERWWEQREFRELPHILYPEERIRGLVNGKLLGARRPRLRPRSSWLVVATDQRIICLKQDRFSRRQVDIAAGEISRVAEASGLRGYQITIHTPERKYRIRIARADAFRFARALAPLTPLPAQQLPPELEAWAWVPGVTTVTAFNGVAGIVSKVSEITRGYAARQDVERLEATVERLETDVDRLRQQVAFLEDLLLQRAEAPFLPQSVDS